MAERPILFSGPMVRAILDGRKTQTRRVMKPQPIPFVQHTPDRHEPKHPAPYIDAYCSERKTAENPRGMSDVWTWWCCDGRQGAEIGRCPYGKPGDMLWVRETYRIDRDFDGTSPNLAAKHAEEDRHGLGVWYDADGGAPDGWGKLRQSIHMPRWASRITLRVVSVRVERLQAVTNEDARAEGVWGWWLDDPEDYRGCFRELWDSINGNRTGCLWGDNPFVWVLGFEVNRG